MNRFDNAARFGALMGSLAVKQALHVEEGGAGQRTIASTIGRLNPENLVQLILTRKAYTDPTRTLSGELKKDNLENYKKDMMNMSKYDPEALKDTVLSLGGGDFIDDAIYKKDRGENAPWYNRIGGRIMHNPKTSILGKGLGMLASPFNALIPAIGRSSHYNPVSDRAVLYNDEPAIAQHELGHALDFNKLYGLRPGTSESTGATGALERVGKGVARDAYMLSANLPLISLIHEARANEESNEALKATLSDKAYAAQAKRRQEVLPAGYGSYVGGALGGFVPGIGGLGALAGMGAGKLYGLGTAATMPDGEEDSQKSKPKAEKPESGKSKKAA